MIIFYVVAGLPPDGGGLSELVPRLAREAARLGHDVSIATVAWADEPLSQAADEAAAGGVRIVRWAPSAPRAIFFSPGMLRGLSALAAQADVVHVHSNWTFPVWWASHCAIGAGTPLVMSPQGCLDPVRLAHAAWKKRLAGLFDRRFLRQASVIHATSDAERSWIERYVGGRPHIEVIPNGVDMPPRRRGAKNADRVRRVLYLGRLHPLKGLDLLLDAWRTTGLPHSAGSRWELVIAGPDEQGTRKSLEARVLAEGMANVSFVGPLYGQEKADAIAAADLFVLPSRSESFGIAVAEALAAGVPVITTKGSPWHEIDGRCGWWVDITPAAIATALAAAMRLDDEERAAMGESGRGLIEAKYRWPALARAMLAVYTDVVG